MRAPLLLTMVAFVCLLPAASGQAPVASLQLQLVTPSQAIEPGNSTTVTSTFIRTCPNMAMVLDAQTLNVQVRAADGANWTIEGPMSAAFSQQVCAQQMEQAVSLTHTLHLAAGSALPAAHVDAFTLQARTDPGGPTTSAIPEQTAPFTVKTAALPPAQPAVEPPAREQPGLGLLGALVALAVAAVVLVRHR